MGGGYRAMSIDVLNLSKSFGNTLAITGINLSVPQGEMLVLLGPSGCGKTTTMRCIAGLERPTSGVITIDGKTVFDERQKVDVPINQRHIGMVFQSYAIWPHMTVFGNVAFPLEMERLPKKKIRDRVDEVLSLVGLEGLTERGASYLSGGQMQRVALARSLVMRPSVLLFDEPLSNLDARLRDRLRVQLREIQTELGITSIYVTHDQREALALADRIIVMQEGHIVQSDDPVAIYQRPRTSSIAEFLGFSNIFDASIIESSDKASRIVLNESGLKLVAGAPPQDASGELAVCVRPEDVTIKKIEGGVSHHSNLPENTLLGEVILASFMGSFMQYRVRASGGEIWEVLSPEVTADIRRTATVALTIPAASVVLLPKS
jgi:iron(III) transport system ATP-binding protein